VLCWSIAAHNKVQFIVAAAEVLHERMASGQDPRGPVAFQAAHFGRSRAFS
jgi:hypothetical protein